LGNTFEPRCDIDPVAVDVALIDDDVADIDTHAKLNPTIFGNGGVALGHNALDFHGASHGVDSAREFDQGTVARGLDDTAAMLCDFRVDEFAPVRRERCESAFFVNAHKPAVSSDIGREDSGQPPLDTRLRH